MINVSKYKKFLEEERERLEEELSGVAERSAEDPEGWVATPPTDLDTQADPNDAADDIEDYVERAAIEKPLEEQLRAVNAALAAMSAGTYGMCTAGGQPHPIEEKRLDANPAALTCVAHMN
jgi:DnaK suppressor protein